jgi:polyisoprenoid-binding protein YceI
MMQGSTMRGAIRMSRRAGTAPGATFAVCLGLAALARPSSAQEPGVEFTVSGTSTVRGWTCSARGVVAVTPATAGAQAVPGFPTGVQAATVTVPLRAFACPNDEMTQHLREAMKADTFPEIVYRLEKYEVAGTQAQATGTMTITGVSQPLSFPVTLKAAGKGVQVEGNTRLDMTKFGVDPPVVFLGLMKVGPQIRIEFKGLVTP